MNPCGADGNEVDIVGHQLRELVAVMPTKGRGERLWQVVNRRFIPLCLRPSR
jgi:hypothetical protein